MIIKKGKTSWVDLTHPHDKELSALKKEFKLHPIIIEELRDTSARSKVELYGECMFIVYHMPIFDRIDRVSRKGEIDFLVTKNSVVSVHYEPLEPLTDIMDRLDSSANYKERLLGGEPARLLYYILETALLHALRQLRHIDEKIEDVRNNLFTSKEEELLEKISYVKRDLLSYSLILRSQESIFKSLGKIGPTFFGEKTSIYFSDLEGDFLKVNQMCENYRQTIESFEHTNTQLMTIKMTKVMQRFSVLAFLTFPWMLFLTLFMLETADKPIIGKSPHDFWIMTAIVVIGILVMTTIFRRKKWL
ncbi:MAG: hypothetical protein KBC26_01140 [Candidatus Pacebacteria bacterium]|nr:hypothetical protein [Candidatus Paceibacterota bacterium]